MLLLLKTLFVIDALMVAALVAFRLSLAPAYRDIVSLKLFVIALLTPAVALFCGNIFIFCAYLAAVVAFNARSRTELAATYVFVLPLMPNVAKETALGSIYLLSVSAAAAMGLGALIGFLVGQGRRSLAQPRYDIALLLLVAMFMIISGHDATFTGLLRGLTISILSYVGPYLLISRGLGSREDVERLLLRLALGGTVVGVTACFQAAKHWLLFEIYFRTLHVPVSVTSWTLALRAGLLRTGGTMLDYSSAGLFLAAVLVMVPVLRSRFRPSGYWTVVAILACGLLSTQSRGAWLAAIIGFVFVMAYRRQWGRAALLVGGGIVAELAILAFATSGRLAEIAGRTESASGTVSYRTLLLSRGMDQIRAHPLFGQSQDQLVANLPDLMQGQHIVDFVNAHLYIAMTAGVPLFLIWCYIWLIPVVDAWRQRSRRIDGDDLMEAPAALIVSVMVALVATSIMDRNLTWPTIALGLAGPCLALSRRRIAAPRASRVSTWNGSGASVAMPAT